MQHRIVVLCGPKPHHANTCATLIRHGLHVAGICIADQRTGKLPWRFLRRAAARKGWGPTFSRAAARVLYQVCNWRADRQAFARLFDREAIEATLEGWNGEVHRTSDYSAPETLAWLRRMEPDVLVAHTPYWIGGAVRGIPKCQIVLGGHPGLTPFYRGSHSAFWAIYKGKPEDVGCTVFVVDGGLDTGDIVAQRHVPVEPGDSFVTLGWKGMIQIAELQAAVLGDFDAGVDIPRRPVQTVPPDSEYDNPTLGEYLRYVFRRRRIGNAQAAAQTQRI